MSMRISFPGGKRVNAEYKGFTVVTDQPESAGGEGSAPSPFDLFLSSLGACAGYYVLSFCEARELPTQEIEISLDAVRDAAGKGIARIRIEILLPEGFPAEYVDACARAADQCAVKKYLRPELQVEVTARRE